MDVLIILATVEVAVLLGRLSPRKLDAVTKKKACPGFTDTVKFGFVAISDAPAMFVSKVQLVVGIVIFVLV